MVIFSQAGKHIRTPGQWEAQMAHLRARQNGDRKRTSGKFTPQGKHGRGKGKNGQYDGKRVHVNQYADHSARAAAEREARNRAHELAADRNDREAYARRMGLRR